MVIYKGCSQVFRIVLLSSSFDGMHLIILDKVYVFCILYVGPRQHVHKVAGCNAFEIRIFFNAEQKRQCLNKSTLKFFFFFFLSEIVSRLSKVNYVNLDLLN